MKIRSSFITHHPLLSFTLIELLVACQPKPWRRPIRSIFTLIELLVVVAIIGILASMLLPALKSAKDAAQLSTCSSNLRQMGLIIHNYANDQEGYFPSSYYLGSNGVGSEFVGFPKNLILQNYLPMANFVKATAFGKNGCEGPDNVYGTAAMIFFCPAVIKKYWYHDNWRWYGACKQNVYMSRLTTMKKASSRFMVIDGGPPNHYVFGSLPGDGIAGWEARYGHNNRANLLFADGHADSFNYPIPLSGSAWSAPANDPW